MTTVHEGGGGDEWRELARALGDAARTVLTSYAVAITAALIFAALVLGAGAPFSERQLESLGTLGLLLILFALIVLYAGLLLAAFLYAKAFGDLRERLPSFPGDARALLETPVTLMFYSSVAVLIGLLLIIIIIGVIPLLLGGLGHLIGKILLGHSLTRVHEGLGAPGTLLVVSAGLSVASLIPFLGFLALLAAVADIAAYFMILQWSREAEGGAPQAPGEALTGAP